MTLDMLPALTCGNCGGPCAGLHGVTGDLGECCYTGTYHSNADAMGGKR